jgi:hypothetical protein
MNKTRMEAFSDGVIAILITILVLELKVPHEPDWAALRALAPVFLTYVLSFVMLGIYWNNHHHLLHAADGISGGIIWANLHLLWLSLVPFVTGWMGENHFGARRRLRRSRNRAPGGGTSGAPHAPRLRSIGGLPRRLARSRTNPRLTVLYVVPSDREEFLEGVRGAYEVRRARAGGRTR